MRGDFVRGDFVRTPSASSLDSSPVTGSISSNDVVNVAMLYSLHVFIRYIYTLLHLRKQNF